MQLQAESQVTRDKVSGRFLAALLNWTFFIEKARTLATVGFFFLKVGEKFDSSEQKE